MLSEGLVIRSILLAASRSKGLERQFRSRAFARRAVRRFMPGESSEDALRAARSERAQGAAIVLTMLGENVETREEARAVADEYRALLEHLAENGLAGSPDRPVEISVKLTQLGLDMGADVAREGLETILASRAPSQGTLWVDMEDSGYVDRTLDLYTALLRDYPNLGVCLQAYLFRTPVDLHRVLNAGGTVRLVKGAYREPPSVAYGRKADVDRAFVELGLMLRDHPPVNGGRHVLGTHDMRIIEELLLNGAGDRVRGDAGRMEVQMLYGIATRSQRKLLELGVRFGVLISYGTNWFPWYMRRLAERPANVWFVARSVVRR